jgi:hypothetical protein
MFVVKHKTEYFGTFDSKENAIAYIQKQEYGKKLSVSDTVVVVLNEYNASGMGFAIGKGYKEGNRYEIFEVIPVA